MTFDPFLYQLEEPAARSMPPQKRMVYAMFGRAILDYTQPDSREVLAEAREWLLHESGLPEERFSYWCKLIDEEFLFEGIRKYLLSQTPDLERMAFREEKVQEAKRKQAARYHCGRVAKGLPRREKE